MVDSGSSPDSLEIVRRFPVRLHAIPPAEFNHGRTRDLGASLARGEHLVFLNQDAVPCSDDWLVTLAPAAPGRRRVRRRARRHPGVPGSPAVLLGFVRAPLLLHPGVGALDPPARWDRILDGERRDPPRGLGSVPVRRSGDHGRQEVAAGDVGSGGRIAYQPEAAVYHTHNYTLRQVIKRCQQEGFGWKLVGETYSFGDMLATRCRWTSTGNSGADCARARSGRGQSSCFPSSAPGSCSGATGCSESIRVESSMHVALGGRRVAHVAIGHDVPHRSAGGTPESSRERAGPRHRGPSHPRAPVPAVSGGRAVVHRRQGTALRWTA